MADSSTSLGATECRTSALIDRRLIVVALALVVANLVVFSQVLTFDFLIWDDEFYVVPHLQREGGLTLESVRWAFANRQAGWVTPLPYLSLFADTQVYGLNPAGYHFTNLLLHCASTLVLLWVLVRMTGDLWPSSLAALLFAIHPLHVEPVVWVTTRWELLCGLFWLLGLAAYVRYCRTSSRAAYLAIIAAYICAMMSKPMALTFPFALLLLDFWPLRRILAAPSGEAPPGRFPSVSLCRALFEKLPLFVISAIGLYLALDAKREFLATKNQLQFPFSSRLLNSIETYAVYGIQFFWPSNLSFFYPHPAIEGGPDRWRVAAAAALLLAVTAAAVLLVRRQPWFFVGWFWYLGVFVPAIGWVQVEEHARADRYTYIPLIGLSLVVCWYVSSYVSKLKRPALARFVVSTCLVLILIPLTHRQASYWRDSETLMLRGLQVDKRNFKAWFNLGHLAVRERNLAAAEAYFRGALDVYDGSRSNYLVGHILVLQGKPADAVPYFERSLERDASYTRARGELAGVLSRLGNDEAARHHYRETIEQNPRDPWAHTYFAHFLSQTGDYAAAAKHYRHILQVAPDADRIPALLGDTLEKSGDYTAALQFYRDHYERHPERIDIGNRLAWLMASHPDDSIRDGAAALRLAEQLSERSNYEDRNILDTLAAACAETGDYRRAIAVAGTALVLARKEDDDQHARAIERRLDGYRNERPFRDAPVRNIDAPGSSPGDSPQSSEALTSR